MPDPLPPALNFPTLTALLHHRASRSEKRPAYAFLSDGENESERITYAELERRALAIAHRLRLKTSPGDRALLLYAPGLEFMAAFFGCLLAGVIAVPSYPPKRNRPDPRLKLITEDSTAKLALTNASILREIEPRLQNTPSLQALAWIATDDGDDSAPRAELPEVKPEDLAFLQYTSGSTANPKGVMVSHANLIHNLTDLDRGWGHDRNSTMVTWLPIFHDMGLIYGALMPLFRGFLCVMLPPASFLQRPIRWLETISKYRGTHSAAPNFAYDLCVATTNPEQRDQLDLSCWHMSLNAAEPVRADTLKNFNETFAPTGLSSATVKPGFGLAEATLKVTSLPREEPITVVHIDAGALAQHEIKEVPTDHFAATPIVGCGWGQVDNEAIVVNPETAQPSEPDRVGEIWFRGPSVAQGYWQRSEPTAKTFHALLADGTGPWMRTGDLGFARGKEIFVTGRLKDLIIIRGLNHYPQDIELTIENASPAIRAGCSAAFSVTTETGGEGLAIVAEIERTFLRKFDCGQVVATLRAAVTANHELPIHSLTFIRPASIPKTSSGKIQRSLAKHRLQTGDFKEVANWVAPNEINSDCKSGSGAPVLESFIRDTIARLLKIDGNQIDATAPFAAQGLDSLTAVELSGALETHLGRRLSPTLAYDFPHVRALATHLTETQAASDSPTPQIDPTEPIAVVGMSCRFPGADSIEAYWDLLQSGRDAITPVPPQRWDASRRDAPAFGGFLSKVDEFDAEFFGLSAREAELMDPQQRLLLESSWTAIEHAGINPSTLAASNTGVFVGISTHDYRLLLARSSHGTAPHTGTGNALSIAANRLSYALDLRGPSMAVDTACSSSLVAIHHAIRALRQGDTDLALAAGVNLMLAPDVTESFAAAGMLAPDGHCKTFDTSADGYVRGEGVGVVLLKKLSAAQRDGDTIYATVHGSAINQDGRSNGLTAPNGPAQQAVIRAALGNANVSSTQISFVETHGTGTTLGDPIEINALHAVLSTDRSTESPCRIGAVKSQIGHLEAAAGMAGFIKTALSLHQQRIPGNLHLQELNPALAATHGVFQFPDAEVPWKNSEKFAGVSSFGFGGTNAHVILGAGPEATTQPSAKSSTRNEIYGITARDSLALKQSIEAHANHLESIDPHQWSDTAFTATQGRAEFSQRVAVVASSPTEAAQKLSQAEPVSVEAVSPRIAFLFSGQGSLYAGAGKELRQYSPIFSAALESCRREVIQAAGWDVVEALDDETKLAQTEYAQVALFTLEYGLARHWQAWGVEPMAVAGHSVGEYAAAVIAGVMDLSAAIRLLATRAKLMGELGETGAMAAVMGTAETIKTLVTGYDVEIGAYNSPHQTVITGRSDAVEAASNSARTAGLRVTPLAVKQGYHSAEMEPMLDSFRAAAEATLYHDPSVDFVSSHTGQKIGTEITHADYWTDQIRHPVRWIDTTRSLSKLGCDIVIEVGPRNLLSVLSTQSWPDQPVQWVTSLKPEQSDHITMLEAAAHAWKFGTKLNWSALHAERPNRRLAVPTYPFQRERFWIPKSAGSTELDFDEHTISRLSMDPALSDSQKQAIPALMAAMRRLQE
ncbi:AMP-binding protein, partial [Opitutaceae bacterium]|nr:AMP-binding protein [Opitutaceae bacterium]